MSLPRSLYFSSICSASIFICFSSVFKKKAHVPTTHIQRVNELNISIVSKSMEAREKLPNNGQYCKKNWNDSHHAFCKILKKCQWIWREKMSQRKNTANRAKSMINKIKFVPAFFFSCIITARKKMLPGWLKVISFLYLWFEKHLIGCETGDRRQHSKFHQLCEKKRLNR